MTLDQPKMSDLVDVVQGLSSLGLAVLVSFGVLLIVIWVVLPFAVLGIKPRLDRMNARLNEANARLDEATVLLARIARLFEEVREPIRNPRQETSAIPAAEREDTRTSREWAEAWTESMIPETKKEI